MMKRQEIIKGAIGILDRAGFSTSDPAFLLHSGFDIVARRDNLILIIKTMVSDNLSKESIMGMIALARGVGGTPLIISADGFEDGVMYSRFCIPMMSLSTFYDLFVEEVPPLIYSAPGGFYVRLDSDVLRTIRHRGMSLGDLAEAAGVSRRAIQMYEDGMGAKLTVALRLEKALGMELIIPIDPLGVDFSDNALGGICMGSLENNELAMSIFEKLNEMGYSVEPTSHCPFDALTKDRENLLFTGVGIIDRRATRRARAMANISGLLERDSVLFVEERGSKTSLKGTPIITYIELESAGDKKRIIELIRDRG